MNKKLIISVFPIFLLAFFIAVTPDFPFGMFSDGKVIEIRFEDILIAVLGFIWIINIFVSKKEKLIKPPLFLPIVIWLGIGFVSSVINLILGNIGLVRSFFYFLKEVEFFLIYFYVFYHIKNRETLKLIINSWVALIFANALYVVYQIFLPPSVGEVGTAALCEYGVLPTGAFFLVSFVFLLNIFLYHYLDLNISKLKKVLLGIAVLSPTIGIFGSGSKACLLGAIFAVFISIAFLMYKKRNLKLLLSISAVLVVMAVIFFLSAEGIPRVKTMFYIFSPVNMVKEFVRERGEVMWTTLKLAMDRKSAVLPIIGFGKSYVTEAHNQFVRNYVETGIFGSLAFLFLIFSVLKISFDNFVKGKDNLRVALSAGLLIMTLTMIFISLSVEVFIVVKPAEVFWYLSAVALAAISIDKKENE